jgi:hypothetical protein
MTKRVSLSNGAKSVVGALLLAASFGMQAEAWADSGPTLDRVSAIPNNSTLCVEKCEEARTMASQLVHQAAFLLAFGAIEAAQELLQREPGTEGYQVDSKTIIERAVNEDCRCMFIFRFFTNARRAPSATLAQPQPL